MPPLPALTPVPFAEAIAWARARQVVLPESYYGQLQGLARSMAFSVAGIAKLDQLQTVLDSLVANLESGESFGQWKKRVREGEIPLDLPAHRIENVFRTNTQGHYGRGRCEQQKRTLADRPYFLYDAVNDSRVRLTHAAMDGFVARYDDPTWRVWTPPSGYQCRCRRIALSEEQAKRFIAADAKRLANDPELAKDRATAQPDKGWDYDPCAEPDEGLRRAWARWVGKAHPLLAEVAQQVMAQGVAATVVWPLLQGGAATLDDIKRLGGERLQELLDLVTPDDRQLFPAMTDRGIRVEDMINRGGLSNAAAGWLRSEMLRLLKGVRPVGGQTFNLANKSGKGVELSKRVAAKLPDAWVEKVNASGAPYKVAVAENSRGWHSGWQRKIQTNSGSTAEHEWAHAVQNADPILDKLFQDEHQRRTIGEALEWLGPGYKKDELTRKDGYIDAYQGKEYKFGGALEVITMALQAVLGEDYRANAMLADMLWDDREMLRLTLGVLFHYLP